MSMKKRWFGCFVLLIALTFFSPFAGQAGAAYPEKPITMIIPKAPEAERTGLPAPSPPVWRRRWACPW